MASAPLPSAVPKKCAELDGSLHPDFRPVAAMLARQLRSYSGGAAVCIYHRGECVVDLWGGAMDRAGRPWRRDTMSPSFSTTKGVASTLVHIMVDRGLLDYDARVVDYWPEFGRAGKKKITLRQVLAHQSGLYHIRQMIDHADRMLDWEYMIRAIESTRPIHEPGKRTGYHGLTYGFLVGEILQRVTGEPFARLVQKEIAEPLGLDGMYIGAPDEVLHRAAELIWSENANRLRHLPLGSAVKRLGKVIGGASSLLGRGMGAVGIDLGFTSILDALAPRGIDSFNFGAADTLRVAIPAVNGLFTARSLARMYAALAAEGEIDGVRLLSRRTLRRAIERQQATPGRAVLPFDMRWRLGYHGVFTTRGFPSRAFGHFGFGGSGAWADPRRNLAVAMTTNSGMGTPFGDTRLPRISGAALISALRRGSSRALAPRRRTSRWTALNPLTGRTTDSGS